MGATRYTQRQITSTLLGYMLLIADCTHELDGGCATVVRTWARAAVERARELRSYEIYYAGRLEGGYLLSKVNEKCNMRVDKRTKRGEVNEVGATTLDQLNKIHVYTARCSLRIVELIDPHHQSSLMLAYGGR